MQLVSISPVLVWCVLGIFGTACLVWAVMLIGAWAGSLDDPGRLRRIALKPEYSSKIMRVMVRELVGIAAACAVLIVTTLRMQSQERAMDSAVTTLLCQVLGEGTPSELRGAIRVLARVPTHYEKTLKAYDAFLSTPDLAPPDVNKVEDLLGEESDPYALRLRGLAHEMVAVRGEPPARIKKDECTAALGYFRRVDEWKGPLPGDPERGVAAAFRATVKGSIATVSIGLAEAAGPDTPEGERLLGEAVEQLEKLRASSSSGPIHVNLLCALSLQGDYPRATQVLEGIAHDSRFPPSEKQELQRVIEDLKLNPELKPFAASRGEPWPQYVDRVFHQPVRVD
jgi:hypothetical protein